MLNLFLLQLKACFPFKEIQLSTGGFNAIPQVIPAIDLK